ncbi:hypothetical protein DFH06DRAFT_1328396 [Mycena polygramma]|nr:hypothetical protein DFH06DRAFT_1328396 [Mycena polygramma]
MELFGPSKSGAYWTLGPNAPSGVLMRGASPGGFVEIACALPRNLKILAVARTAPRVLPEPRRCINGFQNGTICLQDTASSRVLAHDAPIGGLGDSVPMPAQDDGASSASFAVLPGRACRTDAVSPVCAMGRADYDGPNPGAGPWAAAPTASGASLALAFTTGGLGSLPVLTRTPPINLGEGLAPIARNRLGLLAFWLHAILLCAGVVILFRSNVQSASRSWLSYGKYLAGARVLSVSPCSSHAPLSDWVHHLSATPQTSAPLDSDSRTPSTHTGTGSLGGQRNSPGRALRAGNGVPPHGGAHNASTSSTTDIAAAPTAVVHAPDEINIMYWNIYHDFTSFKFKNQGLADKSPKKAWQHSLHASGGNRTLVSSIRGWLDYATDERRLP